MKKARRLSPRAFLLLPLFVKVAARGLILNFVKLLILLCKWMFFNEQLTSDGYNKPGKD
jgi:hypothetical protein